MISPLLTRPLTSLRSGDRPSAAPAELQVHPVFDIAALVEWCLDVMLVDPAENLACVRG